jgi:hypothetical protein
MGLRVGPFLRTWLDETAKPTIRYLWSPKPWTPSGQSIVLTSNTYGHVLEQRQRQVAMGTDAVPGSQK